ncbi:hypothetical protein HII12_002452 [Brettanomyces bruxellensis]|uniref:Pre-mRNA-splicing factor CEF1 n=1 Tax=Dekkera bruxellensis TaxID=5007 RepID=A0A8H6BJ01_DEKBR|nr:hypothetical protein HII12_002452 [Brettanomyces bruxellensis]
MAPVYVRGGVWTNVEDEILKAAIAKYGLNQWSRVSSLLPKKSAKQCKQRWKEWLDPRIKKLDWDRSEDEKLLRLIKLRPNQWNSIGIMMNRTVNQCIERYQQLLGESLETEASANGIGEDSLKLVGNSVNTNDQGQIEGVDTLNLNAESKPARPDSEEMDVDEKEMLSEAKARLANTEGKKAKRKARERMLDESNRIAMLQRRRELKQAGINSKITHKKKFDTEMDYNADIAFERQPKAGRFDTSEEDSRNIHDKDRFGRRVEDENIVTEELKSQRKKERKRAKGGRQAKSTTSYSKSEQLYENNDDAEEVKTRSKLQLSTPGEEAEYEADETGRESTVEMRLLSATREIEGRKHERSVLFEAKGRKRDIETYESGVEEEEKPAPKKIRRHNAEHYRKKKEKQLKKELAKKLMQLPKPIHNNEHLLEGFTGTSIEEQGQDTENVSEKNAEQPVEDGEIFDKETHSSRLGLPIPHIKNSELKIANRSSDVEKLIMQEMKQLIEKDYDEHVLKKARTKNDGSTTDKIWREARIEVERKIKEETGEMDSNKLKECSRLIAKKSAKHTHTDASVLLQLVKSESEISTALEKNFGQVVNAFADQEQQIKDRVSEKLQELQKLKDESEVNDILADEERKAIELRSQRLQQGIDEMNLVISKSKGRLTF